METDDPLQAPSAHSINAAVTLDSTHSFTQCSSPFITCHSSSVLLTSTSHHPKLLLEIIEKYDTQVYGVSTSREGGFGDRSTGEIRSSLGSGERSRGGQLEGANWNGKILTIGQVEIPLAKTHI